MSQQIKRAYGWKKQQHDARDNFFGVQEPIALPASFRLVEGMPEIWDQGQTNSCTAHSASAAYEYELSQQHLPDFMPSRLFLYYNERIAEGTTDQDAGATIRDSVKALAKYGTLPESYWPFTESTREAPPANDYQLAIRNIVTSYSAVPQTIQAIKTAIFQRHPVIFGFLVYESFETPEVARTGIQPLPAANEQCLGGHAVCFTKDTKISLLDGRELSLEELMREFPDGKEFYVYSCDTHGNIKPGRAHHPRLTNKEQAILKVTLDSGEVIRCTYEHPFLMRDGNYKKAKDLLPNDSLMPLYRKRSEDSEMGGYEQFLNPKNQKWVFTHRMVATPYPKGMVVHHKDFNKNNNSPNNLEIMSWEDHTKLHNDFCLQLNNYSKSERGRQKSRELMNNLWANNEWRAHRLEINSENGKKVSAMLVAEGRCGTQTFPKEQLVEMGNKMGKETARRRKTDVEFDRKIKDSAKKAGETSKKKFKEDESFRLIRQQTARKNLEKHNNDVKNGKKKSQTAILHEKWLRGEYVIPESKKKASRENADKVNWKRWHPEYNSLEEYKNAKKLGIINHKVLSIEPNGTENVYDITVDEYHNFALSAGVFVHNCAVGFDDSKQAFLIRNSWGKEWGQSGYFWMSYQYITNPQLASDFWIIEHELESDKSS